MASSDELDDLAGAQLALQFLNDGRRFVLRADGAGIYHDRTPSVGYVDATLGLIAHETGIDLPAELESQLFDAAVELERRGWTLPGRTAAELLQTAPAAPDSLVAGLLVRGWTTKLAAREKVGKGTVAFYLFGRLERNEETVFGPAYGRPVTSLLLTEEPEASVREKVEQFGLTRSRIIYGHELRGRTWEQKVEQLVNIAALEGHEIVFLDNISRSAAVEDEAGPELARAIEYLMDALRVEGLTGLVDHHHKKGKGPLEDKSRGSTAIAGATDINVDMVRDGRGQRRRLVATGRLAATCWERVVELTQDRTDFVVAAGSTEKVEQEKDGQVTGDLLLLQMQEGGRATVREFVAALYDGQSYSAQSKQYKAAERRLKRLVDEGLATASGERPIVYVPVVSPAS